MWIIAVVRPQLYNNTNSLFGWIAFSWKCTDKKKLTNPMQIESAETDSSASAVDCYYMAAS